MHASLPMLRFHFSRKAAQRCPCAGNPCLCRSGPGGHQQKRVRRFADACGQMQQADDESCAACVADEHAARVSEERLLLFAARRDAAGDQSAAHAARGALPRTLGSRASRALHSSMNASIHALKRADSVIGPMWPASSAAVRAFGRKRRSMR